MIPLPIVSAIAFVMNTIPTKLPTAASPTAFTGVNTFVATTVAIAFAASWNPLKKSNEKTIAIAIARSSRTIRGPPYRGFATAERRRTRDLALGGLSLRGEVDDIRCPTLLVLGHDVAQHIRDILAEIGGLFQALNDFFAIDDPDRVSSPEKDCDARVHEVVGDIFEAVDLDRDPFDLARLPHVADHADGVFEETGGLPDDLSQLDHRPRRLVQAVEVDPARRCLDHVEDAVEAACEGLDVFPVNGSDERLVQLLEHRMDLLIRPVFDLLDPDPLRRHVREIVQQSEQRDRALIHRPGNLFQLVEKMPLLRHNPLLQPRASPPRTQKIDSGLFINLAVVLRSPPYSPTSTPDASSCWRICFPFLRFPANPLIPLRVVSWLRRR